LDPTVNFQPTFLSKFSYCLETGVEAEFDLDQNLSVIGHNFGISLETKDPNTASIKLLPRLRNANKKYPLEDQKHVYTGGFNGYTDHFAAFYQENGLSKMDNYLNVAFYSSVTLDGIA
jgi:hypothetical protein